MNFLSKKNTMRYFLFILVFFTYALVGQNEYWEITKITTSISNQLEGDLITQKLYKQSTSSSFLYKFSTEWFIQDKRVDLQITKFDSDKQAKKIIESNILKRLSSSPKIYQNFRQQTYYLLKSKKNINFIHIHHGVYYIKISNGNLNLAMSLADIILDFLPPFYPKSKEIPFLPPQLLLRERLFLKHTKQKSLEEMSYKTRLDTLSKIVLNTNQSNLFRLESLKALNELPIAAAKEFLFNHIKLTFTSDFFPDNHFYMHLQPCYELLKKEEKLNLEYYLFERELLKKKWSEEQLKLLVGIIKNQYKYRENDIMNLLVIFKNSSHNTYLKKNSSWLLDALAEKTFLPLPPSTFPSSSNYDFKIISPKPIGICSDIKHIKDLSSCLQKEVEKQVIARIKLPKWINLSEYEDTAKVSYIIEYDGSIKEVNACFTGNERYILPVTKALKKVKLDLKWEKGIRKPRLRIEMNHFLRLVPLPPKLPIDTYTPTKLSKSDTLFFKKIEQNLIALKKQTLLNDLDTLKKIILDNKAYFFLRKRAIELIKQFPILEAKLFLSQLFDTYLYDEYYKDRGFFMHHFLICEDIWTLVDFDQCLYERAFLSKCRNPFKLKLIAWRMTRKFSKDDCMSILDEYLVISSNKCVEENIIIIKKELEKNLGWW